jgi:hypothetical protein
MHLEDRTNVQVARPPAVLLSCDPEMMQRWKSSLIRRVIQVLCVALLTSQSSAQDVQLFAAHQLVLRFKDIPACGLGIAPNPCGEFLEVSGLPPGTPYRIVSDRGAVVLTGICAMQPFRVQVSAISPGHYTLHAETKTTVCSAPFVKMN